MREVSELQLTNPEAQRTEQFNSNTPSNSAQSRICTANYGTEFY